MGNLANNAKAALLPPMRFFHWLESITLCCHGATMAGLLIVVLYVPFSAMGDWQTENVMKCMEGSFNLNFVEKD